MRYFKSCIIFLVLPFSFSFLITIALSFLIGCPSNIKPKPAPIPSDTDQCKAAELNLKKLQCKDRSGQPMWINKLGEHFSKTCRRAQISGRIFLNPICIATAISCEKAAFCPAKGM